MWEYAVAGAAGALIGVLMDRLVVILGQKHKEKYEQTLIRAFGNPIYLNQFGLDDVYEWTTARKEKLAQGSKIVVMKADAKQLRDLEPSFSDFGSAKFYLLMALLDFSSEKPRIVESVLIKYGRLADDLEDELTKGDGAFVVEG